MDQPSRLEVLYGHLKQAGVYDYSQDENCTDVANGYHKLDSNGLRGSVAHTVTDPLKYALAAADKELATLARTAEGDRNEQLNRSAYNLYQLAAAGHLDPETVTQALTRTALAIGLPAGEVASTVASARNAAMPRALAIRQVPDAAEQLDIPVISALTINIPTPLHWPDIEHMSGDVDWLIDGIIERGKLYALYAAAKTGKSLFVQYLVAQLVQTGVKVMYLDYENSHQDLKDRFFTSMQLTSSDLQHLLYFSFPMFGPLDTVRGAASLQAVVDHYQPSLIIYDTTARMIKDSEQESDTFNALNRLSHMPIKARGITQVRIDHAGKDETKGQRGASGKNDDVDAVLRLHKGAEFPNATRFTLYCELQRSGHHAPKINYLMTNDPLTFTVEQEALPYEKRDVNDWLDTWGAPNNISNPKARDLFADHKIPIPGGSNGLASALQIRKKRATEGQEAAFPHDHLS